MDEVVSTPEKGGEEKVVTREDYVENTADSMRCVDERKDFAGENLGVQMPGGAEHVVDLMRVALAKAGNEVDEETLWSMANKVFASDTAVRLKIKPGVHIDDEHGHISEEGELETRVKGCGYDGVRTQVLERMGVTLTYEPGTDIAKARGSGWGVQVLTGEHVPNATAAVNHMEGKTLKTQVLLEVGRVQSFNYDVWAVKALADDMEDVLEEFGYEDAGDLLEDHAEEWGIELYGHTLDILTQGRLAKSTLVEIR